MGGGSKTTSTTTVTQTAEEKAYTQKQIELATKQLQYLEEQHQIQTDIYTLTKPLLEQYTLLAQQDIAEQNSPEYQALKAKQNQLTTAQMDSALRNMPIQDELLQRQLDEIRRGGAATDEQKALIKSVADRALESGQTDINRFLDQGIDKIRNQMAPARGFRPDDAPMIDAAQRVLEEATRQQGQLTSNIRGAQAQEELNYPLNASNVTNQWNQWQQNYNQGMNQFLAGLSQSAAQNRTQLMSQLFGAPMASQQNGLNLLNSARPNPVDFARNTTTTQKQSSGGSIFGSIGGILSGIGSMGSGGIFSSSRQFKENIRPLEAPPGHLLSPGALKKDFAQVSGGPLVSPTKPDNVGGFAGILPAPKSNNAGGFAGVSPTNPDMPRFAPPTSGEDALAKLRNLPVATWQYKPETGLGGQTHIGPMAEDFNTQVMGKGPEPFINTVDAIGSLMASVQALDKRMTGIGLKQAGKKRAAANPWG